MSGESWLGPGILARTPNIRQWERALNERIELARTPN